MARKGLMVLIQVAKISCVDHRMGTPAVGGPTGVTGIRRTTTGARHCYSASTTGGPRGRHACPAELDYTPATAAHPCRPRRHGDTPEGGRRELHRRPPPPAAPVPPQADVRLPLRPPRRRHRR